MKVTEKAKRLKSSVEENKSRGGNKKKCRKGQVKRKSEKKANVVSADAKVKSSKKVKDAKVIRRSVSLPGMPKGADFDADVKIQKVGIVQKPKIS